MRSFTRVCRGGEYYAAGGTTGTTGSSTGGSTGYSSTGGSTGYSSTGSTGYTTTGSTTGTTTGTTWTYNGSNQLTSAVGAGTGTLPAPTGLSYDTAGHLTGINGLTLSYDPWGRLARVSGGPSGDVTFHYDSFGRRVSKTAGGQTTFYLYAGLAPVAELDSSGNLKTVYTWGPEGLISDRVQMQTTPQSRFYLFDDTGSTRALLDSSGNILEGAAYTAFGSPYSGSLNSSPFGWQGQEGGYTDSETGLTLMGARYYSPSMARFISRDPSGPVNGANVCLFCSTEVMMQVTPRACL